MTRGTHERAYPVSERPYKVNKLGRAFAARLTDEDYEIIHASGPGVRAFYGKADRSDAEQMFARCDSATSATRATKKEETQNRSSGCGDGPL